MFASSHSYSRGPAITRHEIRSSRSPIAQLLKLSIGNTYERTTVRYSHCCVTTTTPFTTSNRTLYGRWEYKYGSVVDGLYVVYSYGEHFPIYIYDRQKDIWYGNADTYSVTTSRHQTCARPLESIFSAATSRTNNPNCIKWLTTPQMKSIIRELHYPQETPTMPEPTSTHTPASRLAREPRYKGNFNFPKLIRQLSRVEKTLRDKNLINEAQLVRVARTGIVHLLNTPMLVQGGENANLIQCIHSIDWPLFKKQESQLSTLLHNNAELSRDTEIDGVVNLIAALRHAATQDGLD